MKTDLAVTGVGMLTPVGLTANGCMHAVRSGITRLTVQPWPDRIKNWLVGGRIMTWVPYERERRLKYLAEHAFSQAWSRANATSDISVSGPTALLLGSPETIRPGYRFPSPGFDAAHWLHERQVPSISVCEFFPYGACSGQVALTRAAQLLESGIAGSCVIGVADTQWHIRITRWHEDNYRLKCGYLTDGLMPGEAACFLVVETAHAARARGANTLACIRSVSVSRETANILSDLPNTAKGLTDAVRASLEDAEMASVGIGCVWSDLNGETYRAREWAFTELRCGFQTHTQLMHPADCHGDLGAASDANLLGLAVMAQASGWAEGKPSLVFAGSEGGVRAATVVIPAVGRVPVFLVTDRMPRVYADNFELPPLGPDGEDYRNSEDPPRAYFEWQLRQEHLDEIASIYCQRKAILSGTEIPWFRAREPEQRILNHLDAAAAAGAKSLWALASGSRSEDEGHCFAGTITLGTLPSARNLGLIRELIDAPAGISLVGLESGLRHSPSHPHLSAFIGTLIEHESPDVRLMGIRLAGYRREALADRLADLAGSTDPVQASAAVDAIARLRPPRCLPLIEQLVEVEDSALRESACLAGLMMGSHVAKVNCRKLVNHPRAGSEGFAAYLLALCGNFADLPLLFQAVEKPKPLPKSIEAIGLLGHAEAIPHLLRLLQIHAHEETVAIALTGALERITGAGLYETVIVAEKLDLLGGEFEEIEREVERISLAPDHWVDWWNRNYQRFDTRVRWRGGQPFKLDSCIDEISRGLLTVQDRKRAYWELIVQSGQDIPFEPDWFVAQQETAIQRWREWLNDHSRNW